MIRVSNLPEDIHTQEIALQLDFRRLVHRPTLVLSAEDSRSHGCTVDGGSGRTGLPVSFVRRKEGGSILIQGLGISFNAENLEGFGRHTSIEEDRPVSFAKVFKNLSTGFDGIDSAKHGCFRGNLLWTVLLIVDPNLSLMLNGYEPSPDRFDFGETDLAFIEALNAKVDRIHLIKVDQDEPQDSQLGQHFGQVRTDRSHTDDGYRMLIDLALINETDISQVPLFNPSQ